jgi:hypothetical protein
MPREEISGLDSLNTILFLRMMEVRVTKLEKQVKKLRESMNRVVKSLGGGAD